MKVIRLIVFLICQKNFAVEYFETTYFSLNARKECSAESVK